MIRALVFDLDGTLVDSLPGIAGSLNRSLAALGFPTHPLAAVRCFVGNGVDMLARRALPNNSPATVVARLVAAFRHDYGTTWPAGTTPFPAITETLAGLADSAPLAVWSNKPHRFTGTMVAQVFPHIRFAAVLGQRDEFPPKPDPAAAPDLLAALGHPATAVALVGDSTTDLQAARNAGFAAAAVTWGYHDRDQLATAAPDYWIERPADIPALLSAR